MKLINVQAYPIDGIPDHVTMEVFVFAKELAHLILKHCDDKDPNIVMGAIGFAHASLIKYYVTESKCELQNAARLSAISLLNNMDALIENYDIK